MTAAARCGRYVRMGILCLLLSAAVECREPAQAASEYSEDAVKAAYLYRFAEYVDWPRLGEAGKPFVIAIVDSPAVARELRRLVPGHQINNRVIAVVEARRVADTGPAAILFVGRSHADLVRPVLPQLARRSTLVVTDEEGGLDAGSTINFLTLDHRVRFEVSLTAADRARLKISAQLLTVAVRVYGAMRQSQAMREPLYDPS